MPVSVDGYVTGRNDSRENPFGDGAQDLHAWLRPTATDKDRAVLQQTVDRLGAIVMGRRSLEKIEGDGGWGNDGPMGEISCFVLTHHPPQRSYAPACTFVLDGVMSAIRQPQHVADGKDVHLFGATVMQQARAWAGLSLMESRTQRQPRPAAERSRAVSPPATRTMRSAV